jgi:MoxR-like ATPase
MGYQIKNYNDWVSESKTNEGILSAIKNVSTKFLNLVSKIPGLSWVGNMFTGDGSWYLNLYLKSKTKGLPKGINLYPSETTKKLVDAAIKEEGITSVKKTEESLYVHNIDEAKVPLTHPNPRVRSVDYQGFLKKIDTIVVAKKNGISGKAKMPAYLIWGAPGVGKSQLIEGVAKKYDMDFIEVILSQVPPDNLLLPKEDPETGLGDTIPSGSLPVYNSKSPNAAKLEAEKNGVGMDGKPRGGILFFDELSRAPKPNLNAALQIIEARRIDKWKIASEWIIIAAANREEDDDAMYQFSTAMGNRFAQINLVPHLEQWIDYQKTRLDDETGEMIMDPEMIEFLRFNKELFHDMDPDVSPEIFPTPRAWEKAADAISIMRKVAKLQGETLTLGEIEDQVADLLGNDVARQYVAYLNLLKSIDPKTLKEVYNDPKKAALPPKEKGDYKSDAASAMMTAIILDRRGEKLSPEQIKNLVNYAVRLDDPSWAIVLLRRFLEEHPYANEQSKKFDEAGYGETYDYVINTFLDKYPGYDIQNPEN